MWSDIERGFLEMVLLLLNLADIACVASVCREWRRIVKSFARDNRLTVRHRSWLVISDRPYEQAIALMNPLRHATNPLSRRICGAFGDWLAIIDVIDGVYLYHPLLHRVELPRLMPPSLIKLANSGFDLSTYRGVKCIRKVILSSPPTSAECLVAILFFSKGLAFCKPLVDSVWTRYEPEDQSEMRPLEDVVFCNGRLVALDDREFVWSFGFRSEKIDRQLLFRPPDGWVVELLSHHYLVESMGHLLMVVNRFKLVRERGPKSMVMRRRMHGFKIFELGTNGRGWTPVETLGERVMFLTRAMSTVVASDEIEEGLGSDCIYFTEADKRSVASPDWVFFMADRRLVQFPTHDEVSGRDRRLHLFFSMFASIRN